MAEQEIIPEVGFGDDEVALPEEGAPEVALPEVALPEEGAPEDDEVVLPEENAPEVVLPEENAPEVVLPEEGAPEEFVSERDVLETGLRGVMTPDFVESFRFATNSRGEKIERDDDEQKNAILGETIDILNGTPEFQALGGLDLTNYQAGRFRDSPVFQKLFPAYNTKEFISSFEDMDYQERKDFLLTRLTGLDNATLEDYAKAAGRGAVVSAAATAAAWRAGKAAFNLAPPIFGPLGPLSKPFFGAVAGLSAGLVTSFGGYPLAELVLPKPDKAKLLPGEGSNLAGTETAASILGGTPQSFLFRRLSGSPAIVLERLRQGQANSQAKLTPSRSLRTGAYLSDMLPNMSKIARANPKKFVASDVSLAAISGAVVSQAELDRDPVLRAFVELGLGLTPTYALTSVAAKAGPLAKSLKKFMGDYNPLSVMMLSGKRRERVSTNLRGRYQDFTKWMKAEDPTPGPELLDTTGGRKAVQQLLEYVESMGEDPADIARRFAAGGDPFEGLPQSVLDTINRGAANDVSPDAAKIVQGQLSYGMKTRSPAIVMLETYFSNEARREKTDGASKKAADFNRAIIKVFSLAGNREGLAVAQEAQQTRFATLFTSKFSSAVDRAVEAAERVPSSYTRTLPEGEARAEDTRLALVRALETQFEYATAMATRLYRDAAGEVPPITAFKNDAGEDIGLPEFIRFFEAKKAEMNTETLERVRADSFFREIEKTIERIKLELGGAPAAAASPEYARLGKLKDAYAGQDSAKRFDDILSGEAITGRDTRTGTPLLQRGDDGSILPTQENIAALGSIISERAAYPTRRSGATSWKETQDLLKAQKDALVALSKQDTSPQGASDGVSFQTINNLRKSITDAAKDRRAKADNLYGLYAQMKGLIHTDIDNSVAPGISAKLDVARNFYRGFGDAILRSVAGKATKKTGYGENLLDPEEYARGLLQGNMDQKLSRFKELFNASAFLKKRSEDLFDPGEVIEGADAPIQKAVSDVASSVEGFASQVLARDVIAPLQKAIRKAEEDAAGLPFADAQRLIGDRSRAALSAVQAELKGESGVAFREILQADVVNDLIKSTDAVGVLNRTQKLLGDLDRQVKDDFALSIAINSEQPLRTIQSAITSRKPQAALDSLVRTIRRNARTSDEFTEKEALDGLTSQLFDFVFQNAGGASKAADFDPNTAFRLLFGKGVSFPKNPDSSLADYMVRSGLSTKEHLEGYKKVLTTMASFDAGARVQGGNVLVEGVNPSVIDDLMLRIGGAKLGAYIGEIMPGARAAGMIEGQAGVKFAQNFFNKIPMLQQFNALKLIVEDPTLLSLALQRGLDPSQKEGAVNYLLKKLGKKLGAFLIPDPGTLARVPSLVPRVVRPSDPDGSPEDETPGKQSSLYGSRFSRQPNQQVAQAPQQQPEPFLAQIAQAAQPAQAPANAPRPAGRVNPETVKKMAALFPEGGIASMMG